MQNTNQTEYVVIDIETTGLNRPDKGGRILEISAKKINQNFETVDTFYSLINHTNLPKDIATKVHGITAEDLKDAPYYGEVLPKFFEFVKDCVLVFHNAGFDYNGFLKPELNRYGYYLPHVYEVKNKEYQGEGVIDTVVEAKKVLKTSSYKLEALAKIFGITYYKSQLHSAEGDVDVTIALLKELVGKDGSILSKASVPPLTYRTFTTTGYYRDGNKDIVADIEFNPSEDEEEELVFEVRYSVAKKQWNRFGLPANIDEQKLQNDIRHLQKQGKGVIHG